MRPEERISAFELRNVECAAIGLLFLTDFFKKIFSFCFKEVSLHQLVEMTLGFVKLRRVSNDTIEIT